MSLSCKACGFQWDADLWPAGEVNVIVKAMRKHLRCPGCGADEHSITIMVEPSRPDLPRHDYFFQCPTCRKVSFHPEDIKNNYCGNCHEFMGRRY